MLMNVKQLQERLNVSRRTVFELIHQGLPTVRLSERILRFDPDAVDRWIKSKAG